MQTFLPLPNIVESLKILDNKRLGKQRVEAFQIRNTLIGKTSGWHNHPAVKMWDGYIQCLTDYMNNCIKEWICRGYQNNMQIIYGDDTFVYPPWFGEEKFHASHRSNLLRKDFNYYSQFGWSEPTNLPYYWPV